MNWVEIIRLIMQIWPLIEQILKMIEDADKRKEIENEFAKAFGDMLKAAA